ncbi:hypothetical protein JVU11DRAFT_3985 [Chiua virens]|nr:hypothetical protein JVU11DRAFT_3985 [Chiua virens]
MDAFNADQFLAKEWLVKVDVHTSTPYLIKFNSSAVDLTCCIMVTDTKQTWVEAFQCCQVISLLDVGVNVTTGPIPPRSMTMKKRRGEHAPLTSYLLAHSLGGMPELSFEVVESNFGDFAFQLECDAFKFRWETNFVGHKTSADILSKHLIMPLISTNHLAFSSPDVLGDLSPIDLDKAVDKVARTARRTFDTHVKNALSKPRLATTIRRITAAFNFISDPPTISTDANTPVLLPPSGPMPKITSSSKHLKTTRTFTPEPNPVRKGSAFHSHARPSPIKNTAGSGSATEPEDGPVIQSSGPTPVSQADQQPDTRMRSPTPPKQSSPRPGSTRSRNATKAAPSDTDSSPVRPIKKSKPRVPSSDEDSEGERRKPATALRQPIKRGGKRF